MHMFGMSTSNNSFSDLISDTSILTDRSMSCESIIDMNHNNWLKVARKLSFTDETEPNESQFSGSQSTSNDDLTAENSQETIGQTKTTTNRTSYSQLRLLKLGNVCQSSRKSRQPVIILDQMTKKYKIRVIDYSSWQWQPKIQLNQLTDDELKNVDRSSLQSNQSLQHHISPIKFDKDEELIRELSPDTAIKRFQEVIFLVPVRSMKLQ